MHLLLGIDIAEPFPEMPYDIGLFTFAHNGLMTDVGVHFQKLKKSAFKAIFLQNCTNLNKPLWTII